MVVRRLGVFGYRGPHDLEWGETTHDPTWSQVEAVIHRLDAGEYAGVVLHLNDRAEDEPATEYFSVCGGPGGYIFNYHVGGRYLHYVAPEASEPGETVGVVKRDQGVWVPACHVCHDVELVVEAARWFFRTAEPHPEVSWGWFGRVGAFPEGGLHDAGGGQTPGADPAW
jgi:hypothetical protein